MPTRSRPWSLPITGHSRHTPNCFSIFEANRIIFVPISKDYDANFYSLVVENRFIPYHFTRKSWSDDPSTADVLRQNNTSWVQIDEPKFQSSIASETPLTSNMAYFRFHGRNAEMWGKGDVETRYQYLYSPEEINELAEKVKTVSQNVSMTFVFFYNHWKAYAPHNAGDL
jgi:uncharacterized protein YecE (DUF72 family)